MPLVPRCDGGGIVLFRPKAPAVLFYPYSHFCVVLAFDSAVSFDFLIGIHWPVVSRVAPGRGAWLCSIECFDQAVKRRGFERAWKQSVEADALTTLRNAFAGVITNMTELSDVGSRPDRPTLMKG